MDDHTVSPPKHPNLNRLLIYLFIASLASMLVVGLTAYRQMIDQRQTVETRPTVAAPTAVPKIGFLGFAAQDVKSASSGASLTFEISADSDEQDVVGYDVLLDNSEDKYTVSSVASSRPDFTAYHKQNKNGTVSITGVKKPEVKTATPFEGETILRVTVMPKERGSLKLVIRSSSGAEQTDFINSQTQKLIPNVAGGELNLEIY